MREPEKSGRGPLTEAIPKGEHSVAYYKICCLHDFRGLGAVPVTDASACFVQTTAEKMRQSNLAAQPGAGFLFDKIHLRFPAKSAWIAGFDFRIL